jgi:protein O-mannosyl-transferase
MTARNHYAFPIVAKRLVALQAMVLVLAAWWVYLPASHGDWVWDDPVEVSQNTSLRDPAGLGRIWAAAVGFDYFPLKTTVQWAEWHLWGDQTTGYHGVNVGLHLLSAFLVWHLLGKLGIRWAWLGGLVFAIHPVAVESVAWISELKNTLSLPLLLGAMIAYVRYDEDRSDRTAGDASRKVRSNTLYTLSLLLFLLAMLSKSTVAMFPWVILVHAWWKRGGVAWRDLIATTPFFVISLALGIVTIWFQHHRAIAGAPLEVGGMLSRLAGAGLAVAFYFSKCVFPIGLSPIYPEWKLDQPSPAQFLPWLGLAIVFSWLWIRRASWGRTVLFGLGWFFLNLIPVLGLIPMAYQRIAWVADHFAYISLVGLIGLAAAGMGALQSRICPDRSWPIVVTAGFLCVWLAVASHRYAGIFRNGQTLWTYALERNPNSSFVENDLGKAMFLEGHVAEAAAHYARALQLDPRDAEAHYNLANILGDSGRISESIAEYEQTIKLKPKLYEAYNNLGLVLAKAGRPFEAIAEYQATLRLKPDSFEARCNLAETLAQVGRTLESVEQYELALRIKPDAANVHENLGIALAQLDRLPESISHLETAVQIDPNDAGFRYNLGMALRHVGRTSEASVQFEAASHRGGPLR